MRFRFSALLVLLSFWLLPHAARAEDKDASPTFSLRFNPLAALVIHRYSGEGEVWLSRHLSLVGTVFHAKWHETAGTYEEDGEESYGEASAQPPSSNLTLTGFEGGLRYSAFERLDQHVRVGAFGGFAIGPAWGRQDLTNGTTHDLSQVTGAIEGGGILMLGPVIAEAGFGLQATHDFGTDPKVSCGDAYICVGTTHWFYGSGFTPRILLSVGFVL